MHVVNPIYQCLIEGLRDSLETGPLASWVRMFSYSKIFFVANTSSTE